MQTQNLQIIPRGVKPIIKASQFDIGREFELKLYDGAMAYTPPAGTIAEIDKRLTEEDWILITEE